MLDADDVTIIGGWGGVEKGWNAQVEKRYDWASARFATDDDERRIENVSTVVTLEMAYLSKSSVPGSAWQGRKVFGLWPCA